MFRRGKKRWMKIYLLKVNDKIQHKESFHVVSQGKQKGVRVQFKSDRSLRSKAKASSNSFSALSQ